MPGTPPGDTKDQPDYRSRGHGYYRPRHGEIQRAGRRGLALASMLSAAVGRSRERAHPRWSAGVTKALALAGRDFGATAVTRWRYDTVLARGPATRRGPEPGCAAACTGRHPKPSSRSSPRPCAETSTWLEPAPCPADRRAGAWRRPPARRPGRPAGWPAAEVSAPYAVCGSRAGTTPDEG